MTLGSAQFAVLVFFGLLNLAVVSRVIFPGEGRGMKSRLFSRLVLLIAVTIAAASIISTGARFSYPAVQPASRARVAAAEPGLVRGRLRGGGAARL